MAPDLIDPDELEKDRKSLGSLFAQEYECSFESNYLSAIEASLISECEQLDRVHEW